MRCWLPSRSIACLQHSSETGRLRLKAAAAGDARLLQHKWPLSLLGRVPTLCMPPMSLLYTAYIGQYGEIFGKQLLGYSPKGFPLDHLTPASTQQRCFLATSNPRSLPAPFLLPEWWSTNERRPTRGTSPKIAKITEANAKSYACCWACPELSE